MSEKAACGGRAGQSLRGVAMWMGGLLLFLGVVRAAKVLEERVEWRVTTYFGSSHTVLKAVRLCAH